MKRSGRFDLFLLILCSIFLVVIVGAVSPSGALITPISNDTATAADPGSIPAVAGNVTELNIEGVTTTQSWQGYFGNVSGTIQLADSSDNVMYNWSLASPQGEIYASTSSTLTWSSIACFDVANDGTALENSFGIDWDDVDGVNETFSLNDHSLFYTGNKEFGIGECNNTKIYGAGGVGAFDEVLLTDGANTVFASLLQEDGVGFDGATHDFEMLVLEDGHETDVTVTPYYFWVELE